MAIGVFIMLLAGIGAINLDMEWAKLACYFAMAFGAYEALKDFARELRRKPDEFDYAARMEAAKKALE